MTTVLSQPTIQRNAIQLTLEGFAFYELDGKDQLTPVEVKHVILDTVIELRCKINQLPGKLTELYDETLRRKPGSDYGNANYGLTWLIQSMEKAL